MRKEINIREVTDGLREYNHKIMMEEIEEIMKGARRQKTAGKLPEERIQIQDAADQDLIDSLSDRN